LEINVLGAFGNFESFNGILVHFSLKDYFYLSAATNDFGLTNPNTQK